MANKQRYTLKQIAEALRHCHGMFYLATERLGCCRKSLRNYVNRSQTLRRIVEEFRGKRVDVAEVALDKAVMAGEGWAVQLILRTIGKDRGYTERKEVAFPDGLPPEPIKYIRVHCSHCSANGDNGPPRDDG